MAPKDAAVAASDSWVDPDGFRAPAGLVHAWVRGTNQTVCGVQISRARLYRFSHVQWVDAQPATGRDADEVREVCRKCAAGMGAQRDTKTWRRDDPRP